MIRPILIWPDPVLHEVSKPVVSPTSSEVKAVVADLLDTLYACGGVGLAAIQIGVPLRIFVMDIDFAMVGDRVFMNPEYRGQGDRDLVNEGCLSMPGIVEQVQRYRTVTVQAFDESGAFSKELHGLEAQCAQHEIEHLDGVLMADKFSPEAQELMRLRIKHRQRRVL